jgi:hypothetical protein
MDVLRARVALNILIQERTRRYMQGHRRMLGGLSERRKSDANEEKLRQQAIGSRDVRR